MFIVERDNFSLSCTHPGLRFPSAWSPESWDLEVLLLRSSIKEISQRHPPSWTRQGVWQSSRVKGRNCQGGKQFIVCLYNGRPGEGLDGLRFRRYYEKVSTGTSQIQPRSLTPTSAAASYLSIRVYHQQLIQWKGEEEQIPSVEWIWILNDRQLVPIMTHLQPCLGGRRLESFLWPTLVTCWAYDRDGLLIFTWS